MQSYIANKDTEDIKFRYINSLCTVVVFCELVCNYYLRHRRIPLTLMKRMSSYLSLSGKFEREKIRYFSVILSECILSFTSFTLR